MSYKYRILIESDELPELSIGPQAARYSPQTDLRFLRLIFTDGFDVGIAPFIFDPIASEPEGGRSYKVQVFQTASLKFDGQSTSLPRYFALVSDPAVGEAPNAPSESWAYNVQVRGLTRSATGSLAVEASPRYYAVITMNFGTPAAPQLVRFGIPAPGAASTTPPLSGCPIIPVTCGSGAAARTCITEESPVDYRLIFHPAGGSYYAWRQVDQAGCCVVTSTGNDHPNEPADFFLQYFP